MKVVVKYNDSGVNGGRSTEAFQNETMTFESPDMESLVVSLASVFEYNGSWDDERDDKDDILEQFYEEDNGDIAKFADEASYEATAGGGDRYTYFVSIDGKPILDNPEPVIVFHPGADEYRWIGDKYPDGSIEYDETPKDIEYESSLAHLKDEIKKEVETKHKLDIDSFTDHFTAWIRKIDGEPVTPEKVKKVATEMGYGDRIVDSEKDPAEKMYDIFDKGLSDKPNNDEQ